MKNSILENETRLRQVLSESENFADALSKFKLTATSGNYKTLNKYIKLYNIEFKGNKRIKSNIKKLYSNEQCFKENSTIARHHVKKRIIKEDLIEYKCKCGNTGEWQGKPLVLQLEHKNGVNDDNRIENLTFICPNCHTQTNTYAAKNKIKIPV